MAIFPRGARADAPLRAPIEETNRLLAQTYAKDPLTTWLDIGAQFLSPDGSLPSATMPDGTHPSEVGYQIWAESLIKAGLRP